MHGTNAVAPMPFGVPPFIASDSFAVPDGILRLSCVNLVFNKPKPFDTAGDNEKNAFERRLMVS